MPPHAQHSRLPALDALRAAAMLLGILLHASAPYMHVPLRGLIMPLQEPAASRLPDSIFWIIHSFRVPMFFVVAGFVARELLGRRRPSDFLKNRWRRVALPLLIAYPVLMVAMHPIWLWGWVQRGFASWSHFGHFTYGPELQRAIWGFNHLWFLQYLFLYSLVLWACYALAGQTRSAPLHTIAFQVIKASDINLGPLSTPHPAPARRTPHPWRLLPLALGLIGVGIALFSGDASWYLDFHNAYIPDPRALAYYALFFFLGVALRRDWIPAITKLSPILLLLAALGALPLLTLTYSTIWSTDHGPRQGLLLSSLSDRATLGALVTTIALAASLGLLGACSLLITRLGNLGRFIVDASYWTYLTHLVWIGLGVMLLHTFEISPELKVFLVATFAGAISLVSFVPLRRTRLGRWLGATAPGPN